MADVSTVQIGTQKRDIKDVVSRAADNTVQAQQEYDRQVLAGTYEGRDLSVVFADEIAEFSSVWAWWQDRENKGDYSGIRIRDYIPVSLSENSMVPSQSNDLILAEIHPFLHTGDTETTRNHSIWYPRKAWLAQGSYAPSGTNNIQWNTTNNNNGTSSEKRPYLASHLRDWEKNYLVKALPTELQSILYNVRYIYEERYSSSGSQTTDTGWSWGDTNGFISPSQVMVYANQPFTDQQTGGYGQGVGHQLLLFKQYGIDAFINGDHVARWLCSVPSGHSTFAAIVHSNGYASRGATSDTLARACTCFITGAAS